MPDGLSITTTQTARLMISFLFALPIGWDPGNGTTYRRFENIFPIVSLGSWRARMLIAHQIGHGSVDVSSRVLQGLVTGIGFVGGGAILKSDKSVRGTATAASIWNMAVVGTATAFGLYAIAGVLVIINFISLRVLLPFKNNLDSR